jgi:ABC-type glycerol-3-phosphate transport system substrate-binding protein
MRFRKGFFLLLSIILMTGAMIGCGQRPGKKADILIWHWMTDRQGAFEELAGQYEDLTGLKVNFALYAPSDAYTQKITAAAQTRTLPDIYGVLGQKRDFAAFVKAGHVADLTDEMEKNDNEWLDYFFPKALEVNRFEEGNEFEVKPGVYGVPIDVTNIQMLYNKEKFRQAGLDPDNPPETWDEFIQANRILKEAGLQGMVSGWGEIWLIDCFASNYAFNIMGKEKVLDTIRGKVPYTDPDWLRVLGLFEEIADEEILARGVVTMVNKTAEQLFANERAAFAFNGSWCVNVYRGMNPDLEYGAFLPPAVSDEHPMYIWGGAGSSFIINPTSHLKQEVIEFLRWLTEEEQQVFLAEETLNLPSNRNAVEDIPLILAQFAENMDKITHPHSWPVSESPMVTETLNKGIQSIIIGESTPEEVARRTQRVKERELAK